MLRKCDVVPTSGIVCQTRSIEGEMSATTHLTNVSESKLERCSGRSMPDIELR